jgi:hypothetical protein
LSAARAGAARLMPTRSSMVARTRCFMIIFP